MCFILMDWWWFPVLRQLFADGIWTLVLVIHLATFKIGLCTFAHQQQLSGPPPAEQQTEYHWQMILTLILLVLLGPSPEMTGWIPLHCALMGYVLLISHPCFFPPLSLSHIHIHNTYTHIHTRFLMIVRWSVTSFVFSPSSAWMSANWFFSWALSLSLLAAPDACRFCGRGY